MFIKRWTQSSTCPSRCQYWYGLPLPAMTIHVSPVSLLLSSPNALTCEQHQVMTRCLRMLRLILSEVGTPPSFCLLRTDDAASIIQR